MLYKMVENEQISREDHYSFKNRHSILMSMSQDGSLIGFLNKTEGIIQIYDLDDNPKSLITKLNFQRYKCEFNYDKRKKIS